jgi:hypothetical protein
LLSLGINFEQNTIPMSKSTTNHGVLFNYYQR